MFPPDLLGDDEDLILDLRPHWVSLVAPLVQSAFIVSAVLIAALFLPYRWGSWPFAVVGLFGLAALLRWPAPRLATWATSHYLITTDRAMRRSGLVGRSAATVPLARVTDVRLRQSPLQRLGHAGDLTIEAAGASGRMRFSSVPHPERVQRILFERRAASLRRTSGAPVSVADELAKLDSLHREGALDDHEFLHLKARLLNRP
jgi:membrane protein YdbS with pleckstrin-like domain